MLVEGGGKMGKHEPRLSLALKIMATSNLLGRIEFYANSLKKQGSSGRRRGALRMDRG